MTAAIHGSKRITGVSTLVRKLQASVAMGSGAVWQFRVVMFMVCSDFSIHELLPAKVHAREGSTADAIRGSA